MIRKPIPVGEAIEKVISHTARLGTESVSLDDAYGRVLAEDIVAKHAVPSLHRASFAGFAIRAEDTDAATDDNPIYFKQIGEIGAGHVGEKTVGAFEAYRIMTGAKLPDGANAIVMLEHTET